MPTVCTQGSNCVPSSLCWHSAGVSKASLAGLWTVKSHSGEHSAGGGGGFWLLASKAQPYNGRSLTLPHFLAGLILFRACSTPPDWGTGI